MDGHTEWWLMLAGSPFLLTLASAIVALLIRDLLDPHQWQRYVRKLFVAAVSGIVVFTVIVGGLLLLLQRIDNEDTTVAISATIVVAVGIIPVTALVMVFAFHQVERNVDWYMNSRFRYSFRNGSWPILSVAVRSVAVRSECLPDGATFIGGRISAVKESIGEYRLRVVVGTVCGTRIVLDQTTRNLGSGWVRLMGAVVKAQLGNLQPNTGGQKGTGIVANLGRWLRALVRIPAPTQTAQYQWQDCAYLQIHRLAQRVDARGVVR